VSRIRVSGFGFRIYDFRVSGEGVRGYERGDGLGFGFRVSGFGFMVQGLGCGGSGLREEQSEGGGRSLGVMGLKIECLGFRTLESGFRVSGFGFMAQG